MVNLIAIAGGYLAIGCFCAAVAKRQHPASFWAIIGSQLIVLWPVLLPIGLVASVTEWIYDRL